MFGVKILIPLQSNADANGHRRDFGKAAFAAFESKALSLFGGFTRHGVVAGSWQSEGRRYDDDLVAFEVFLGSIADGARIGELVAFAANLFEQEAITVTYLGLAEIIG